MHKHQLVLVALVCSLFTGCAFSQEQKKELKNTIGAYVERKVKDWVYTEAIKFGLSERSATELAARVGAKAKDKAEDEAEDNIPEGGSGKVWGILSSLIMSGLSLASGRRP